MSRRWCIIFTVRGLHTYFVLEVGVLVHNCGGTLEEFASLKNGVYDNSINCISCVLLELPEFQGRKPLVQHRIATSWGDDTAASATDAFTQFRLGNLPDQIELVMQKNFIEIGTDTGGKPLKSLQSGDVITIKQLISKKRDRWDVAHMAIALDGNLAFHKRGIKGPYEIVSLDDIASKHYSTPTTPGIRWQYWRLRK